MRRGSGPVNQRGRRRASRAPTMITSQRDGRSPAACLVGAALIESLRGFHPAHAASLAQLALAAGMGIYGGLVYRLQLGVVRRLLDADR